MQELNAWRRLVVHEIHVKAERHIRVGDVNRILFGLDMEHLVVDGLLNGRDQFGHIFDESILSRNIFQQTYATFGDAFDPSLFYFIENLRFLNSAESE